MCQKYLIFCLQDWNIIKHGNTKVKEGPLTKNGPIDFAQSWAILT